ncbi:BTAD domain-containing putative transcriptional regulator [Cryptosporangium sp. NPDC048952]|uniref:AfsR/SARP family transcriptional regulator n=1 Tax=Cryptosporangium sp. NPDC048952 TaxID=3363961 RepID=UPI0037167517
MGVTGLRIRVFGRADVLVDGQPLQIARQEATVLAALVAVGGPVRRDQLIDAVWPDDAPRGDGLSPVVARLRKRLSAGGLDIAYVRDRRTYELVGPLGAGESSVVDAARFVHFADAGDRLAAQGRDLDALAAYRAAVDEWIDAPFGLFGDEIPEPCLRLAATLERRHAEVLTHLAEAGLRLGRYDVVGDGDSDAHWMARFLLTLRDSGGPAAEELIDARRAVAGYDDVATRAFDLLSLFEFGFDVPRAHLLRDGPGDRGDAAALLRKVLTSADALGMTDVSARARAVEGQVS